MHPGISFSLVRLLASHRCNRCIRVPEGFLLLAAFVWHPFFVLCLRSPLSGALLFRADSLRASSLPPPPLFTFIRRKLEPRRTPIIAGEIIKKAGAGEILKRRSEGRPLSAGRYRSTAMLRPISSSRPLGVSFFSLCICLFRLPLLPEVSVSTSVSSPSSFPEYRPVSRGEPLRDRPRAVARANDDTMISFSSPRHGGTGACARRKERLVKVQSPHQTLSSNLPPFAFDGVF